MGLYACRSWLNGISDNIIGKQDLIRKVIGMKDEFDVEEARECLLEEIVGCYNCQPWEGGPVWLGPNCPLIDLLGECEIQEEHWEEVLDGFNCPSCGTDLVSEWDEVEIKSEYDKKVDAILEQAQSPELIEKLSSFNGFLEEYPYLGLADLKGIGGDIMKRIGSWPGTNLEPKIWFRARKLDTQSRIYNSREMCAPNPTEVYVREGRYNHTGQSFLYLASDPETAFYEIRQANENVCAVQRFRTTETIRVLDLRHDYFRDIDPEADILAIALIYNGSLALKPSTKSSWKPEYFIPRFVADCARLHGYDGIWFSSTIHFGRENLVVFPQKTATFVPEGECESFLWKESSKKGRIDGGTFLLHIEEESPEPD